MVCFMSHRSQSDLQIIVTAHGNKEYGHFSHRKKMQMTGVYYGFYMLKQLFFMLSILVTSMNIVSLFS